MSIRHMIPFPKTHRHVICASFHSSSVSLHNLFSPFLSFALPQRLFLCMHPLSPCLWASISADRRRVSSSQHLEFCQLQLILDSGGGGRRRKGHAPSLFDVTFFVNLNSGATICHVVPHRPCQIVAMHHSMVVPTLTTYNSTLGDTQHCTRSIVMFTNDFLSHTTGKCTDTTFSNFTEPNLLSKLRHELPPSSSHSSQFALLPQFPSLKLFMACVAKRGSQLSCHLRCS